MGLASFNKMRRIQAEKLAKELDNKVKAKEKAEKEKKKPGK